MIYGLPLNILFHILIEERKANSWSRELILYTHFKIMWDYYVDLIILWAIAKR
jgi:hypothetical protein